MGTEAEVIAKYGPAFAYLVSAILVIVFTKKYLFEGTISKEMFDKQIEREREFVAAMEKASTRLEDNSKQLGAITQKLDAIPHISEKVIDIEERLRTLEMVFSDNIDAVRDLSTQVEKQRRGIPPTQVFQQPRT